MAGALNGKAALVTGGASGIGRATALAFACEGASLVLADVDAAGGEDTAAAARAAGANAHFVRCDVARSADVEALVAGTIARLGRLDCAFNNAGIAPRHAGSAGQRLHEMGRAGFDHMLAINLTGVFLCLKHELRVMAPAGRGAIVNTSSGAGVIGFPSLPHYVASKHGVLGLTKTAAQEYARSGVRVNAVCPGTTDTPMMRAFIGGDLGIEKMMKSTVPTGELGRPEQIAEAVVWLCSDRASFVNGDTMLVDGGTVCR